MTLSLNNLTFIIVTFKSEHIIYDCIESLPVNSNIIIVENSNNQELKEDDVLYDDSDQRLDEKLEKDELIESLIMVFEELKQEQQICIQLFYLQKKSYEEITTITEYSLKEVKSHLQNGRRNLKLLLTDCQT